MSNYYKYGQNPWLGEAVAPSGEHIDVFVFLNARVVCLFAF